VRLGDVVPLVDWVGRERAEPVVDAGIVGVDLQEAFERRDRGLGAALEAQHEGRLEERVGVPGVLGEDPLVLGQRQRQVRALVRGRERERIVDAGFAPSRLELDDAAQGLDGPQLVLLVVALEVGDALELEGQRVVRRRRGLLAAAPERGQEREERPCEDRRVAADAASRPPQRPAAGWGARGWRTWGRRGPTAAGSPEGGQAAEDTPRRSRSRRIDFERRGSRY
jgi:hypothetical protein